MSPRASLRKLRHAEALHAHHLLVLAALGDAHLHLLAVEDAVDLDFGTEGRLHDGYVRARVQVVAVAFEELVRLDAARDDEVARLCALHAGFAEAGHAQLLRVADAHGHLHGDALAVGHAALAFAFGAGVLDRRAGAVAGLAGGGRLHVAQKRVLNGDDAALAAAVGAGDLAPVGAEARALAVGARRQAVVDDLLLRAAATSSSVRRRPTPMSRPSLRWGCRPAACPPKNELKMSPMPKPPPNRSSKST